MRMNQKPENPPGHDDGDEDDSEYLIDETVTVSADEPMETWDLDYDPEDQETHILRVIARTDRTKVQAFILPKEEVEFFKEGENVWTEFESGKYKKLRKATEVTHTDEKPYYHDGDYVLAIKAIGENRHAPDELKFSVKYRRE